MGKFHYLLTFRSIELALLTARIEGYGTLIERRQVYIYRMSESIACTIIATKNADYSVSSNFEELVQRWFADFSSYVSTFHCKLHWQTEGTCLILKVYGIGVS
jgi:hypothetical protein